MFMQLKLRPSTQIEEQIKLPSAMPTVYEVAAKSFGPKPVFVSQL